jgi:hypothetical protein
LWAFSADMWSPVLPARILSCVVADDDDRVGEADVVGVEERLAHVEGLIAGHAQLLGDLRTAITNLDLRMERRLAGIDERLTSLEQRIDAKSAALDQMLDAKIEALDHKLEAKIDAIDRKLDAKVDALDRKIDAKIETLDRKIDEKIEALDRKIDEKFRWMLGLQMTLIAVVLASILAR